MQDKILITGYNGALAQRLKYFLENDYELIYLTSNKKSVDNSSIYYWDIKKKYVDENFLHEMISSFNSKYFTMDETMSVKLNEYETAPYFIQ